MAWLIVSSWSSSLFVKFYFYVPLTAPLFVYHSASHVANVMAHLLLVTLLGLLCAIGIAEGASSRPPLDCSRFLAIANNSLPSSRTRTNDTPYRYWDAVLMRCFAAHPYNKRYYPVNPECAHDSLVMELMYAAHLMELTSFGVCHPSNFSFSGVYSDFLSFCICHSTYYIVH